MTLYENHKAVITSSPLTETVGDEEISRQLSTHISPATIRNSSEREVQLQAKKLTMGSLAAFNNARKEGIFPQPPTLPKEIGRSSSTIETRLSLSPPVNYSTNIPTTLPVSSSGTRTTPVLGKPMICRPIFPNIPFSPFTSPCSSPFAKRREFKESQRVSIEKDGDLVQLNQYKLKEPIGQGSFGIVKLAYNEEDEKHYAMKILSKKKLIQKSGVFGRAVPSRRLGKFSIANPLAKIYTEVAILKKLNHPNVVKLIEVLDDPAEDNLYLVFELLERGEILQVPTTNPLTEEKAWKYFRDVILGIEYLHYQKIIHRDIKPSNLLVSDDDRIKISDFGVCNEFTGEDDHLRSTSGTPAFTAPEALKAMSGSYGGKAADVWQLGITLFAMVYGVVPFHDSSIITLYYKIQHEPLKFPAKPAISNELQDLLIRMLQKDPSSRIMISEIKIHDWITQHGEHPLPKEEENCKSYIQVTDEEIINSVRSIPKLDTLIMVKTMLKNHSFHHPFRRHGCKMKNLLHLNGRSHSAPSSYDFYFERKMSLDRILPAVNEAPRESSVQTQRDDSIGSSDQELNP